jgi:hypothetical protein
LNSALEGANIIRKGNDYYKNANNLANNLTGNTGSNQNG